MLVTFISQCEKKALKRTRRVLDAFANRIGDNVWQTAITENGLATVKKLLRESASRSTAVSCHRVRTRNRTEMVWVVGNKAKFNAVGVVAVNRTKRNILHTEWENNWQYASSIQVIATISALLHDIGKSTVGFQHKLHNTSFVGDPYRHEWISLKLFELIIADCDSDEAWLNRFVNLKDWLAQNDISKQLKTVNTETCNIEKLPPLAQWVAWLIVTHHRLPPSEDVFLSFYGRQGLKKDKLAMREDLTGFYELLTPKKYWVKNPKTIDESTKKFLSNFWQCQHIVIDSPTWQSHIKRWATKALKDTSLMQISQTASSDKDGNQQPISDMFLLYLSRLCLVVGDHNYSSLSIDDKRCVKGNKDWHDKLIANTDRKTGDTKQSLDEHLLGVANFTSTFARFLPKLTVKLPTLKDHNPLAKNTGSERFKWQNKAFKIAREIQKDSLEHGFFGVNMASTGCGKTIGNARIMYGLADPKQGARFTIALGLRVLTLQTGLSFRKDLSLADEQLAILVGGSANKKLFEYNQDEIIKENEQTNISVFGSESSTPLVDEMVYSGIDDIDYSDYDELNIDTLLNDKKARQLLFSPIVTCTVDHIIQASECKRGGGFIAPMLRLLSSDLILDEPDDFNQEDLPALCRLVHLAGVFGSRVLLSSATLTPDMVSGLYQAYVAGRTIYNQSQNKAKPNVVCAWFDEQNKPMFSVQCAGKTGFETAHNSFTKKRTSYLNKQPVRRKADIIDLSVSYNSEKKEAFYQQIAQQLLDNAVTLHNRYHQSNIDKNGVNKGVNKNSANKDKEKLVSIGLIRIANIKHIIPIAQQLFNTEEHAVIVPKDTHIHIACYHSRQLLVLRNYLESRLDRVLKRTEDNSDSLFQNSLFKHQEIKNALKKSNAKNHIFIVIGSPVTEVGRDHDYDWAIVEPSSMRSIIQLAGRVWRHRPNKTLDGSGNNGDNANILLMKYNLRYLTRTDSKNPVFIYPGFETDKFKTHSYDLTELMSADELACIDAKPRIMNQCVDFVDSTGEITSLAQLEHNVMQHTLNNSKLNYVNAYWSTTATGHKANTHLQQLSPFRYSPIPEEDWILVPKTEDERYENEKYENENSFDAYYAEDVYEKGLQGGATVQNKSIRSLDFSPEHPQISPWLTTSLVEALEELKHYEPELGINALATRYAKVSLEPIDLKNSRSWYFHPFLGFVRG